MKRFHRLWNTSGIQFAAYVPFYADCSTTYETELEVVDRPIRLFHGTADDYDPVAPCRAYVERLRNAGRDVQLTEYPDAHHVFDNPTLGPAPIVAGESQTVRHCTIREAREGRLINESTGAVFGWDDSCVERGPHVAFNVVANSDARR